MVEGSNQIMMPFDYDMVQILHKEMMDCGVNLYLSGLMVFIYQDPAGLPDPKAGCLSKPGLRSHADGHDHPDHIYGGSDRNRGCGLPLNGLL